MEDIQDVKESWPAAGSDVQLETWLITVRSDKVQMPDNRHAKRTVVTHPGAVAVLALDDRHRVLLLRQYRHPVGRQLWEIPAGLRDVGHESPLATARRELLEETGYRARDWHTLVDYFSSPGYSTERLRIYLARGLTEEKDNGFEREHEEKFFVTRWVPLAEAVRLALAGKLHNGPAIAGIMSGYVAWTRDFDGLRAADAPET